LRGAVQGDAGRRKSGTRGEVLLAAARQVYAGRMATNGNSAQTGNTENGQVQATNQYGGDMASKIARRITWSGAKVLGRGSVRAI